MDKERRATEQAYKEYLALRQNRSTRGNYVKDDDIYGQYFSGVNNQKRESESIAGRSGRRYDRSGSNREYNQGSRDRGYSNSSPTRRSIEDTPYGASEMRRKNQQIARQGRVNKADRDMPYRGRPEDNPALRSNRKYESRNERQAAERTQTGYSRQEAEKAYRAERKATAKADKKAAKKAPKNVGGKRKTRGLKIALIVVLVMVVGITGVVVAGISVVKNTLDNVGRIELDPNMIGINPQVDSDLRNYRNIAILGIDSRDMSNDIDARSDAMIVASINKETNEIKLFSVYRDTMLYLGDDGGLDKITHAYSNGGPTKTLYAINKNMDLNVKEVMVVNWKAVADTVDALGGIDIEIQESEIKEMNKYIIDTYNNIGGSNALIESAGMQTLNGNQAVTYARIRKDAATGDYRRNERMKIVVKATFEKALTMNPKSLKKISNDILPQVKTNMSTGDMMGMMMDLTSYSMTDSVGFPYDHKDYTGNAFYGVPVTLESNVTKLHEQFFGQSGYVPTQDVRDISKQIINKTGFQ